MAWTLVCVCRKFSLLKGMCLSWPRTLPWRRDLFINYNAGLHVHRSLLNVVLAS